jgi:hypothetical protein
VADIRLALRHLRLRPGFTLVAVVTLALGIGANTAVFTVVHAVLLRPLPYEDPASVVVLTEQTPQFPSVSVTRYNYDDWRARSTSFTAMGAVRTTSLTVSGRGEPERVPAKMISASLLPLLGVRPADGRGFDEADDRPGAEGVALLADGLARRRYPAGDAVGQSLTLDNRPYAIVGVLPAGFELFQPADVYVPFGPWAATLPEDRGWHPGIFPVARLKPGVSLEAARAELAGISLALEQEFPESNRNVRAQVAAAPGPDGPERAARAAPAPRRGGAGPAHRLRERREPAAGPRGRASCCPPWARARACWWRCGAWRCCLARPSPACPGRSGSRWSGQ